MFFFFLLLVGGNKREVFLLLLCVGGKDLYCEIVLFNLWVLFFRIRGKN